VNDFELGDDCPGCGAILGIEETDIGKCFSCGCDLEDPESWDDDDEEDD